METKKLTLTFVKSFPKTSISGENYTSVSIKSKEYGDKYLSGFGNKDDQNWKVGDVVEVLVKQVLKDGKEYLNFEMPKNVTKSQNNSEVLHQYYFQSHLYSTPYPCSVQSDIRQV